MNTKKIADISKEAVTIPLSGIFLVLWRRPIAIEKKVKAAAWSKNIAPNHSEPMANFAENQVTKEGSVFTEIAKPAKLITNPILRFAVMKLTSFLYLQLVCKFFEEVSAWSVTTARAPSQMYL